MGRGGGEGEEETRSGKYESKRALIGCSIMHAKAPRACLFLSLAVPKADRRQKKRQKYSKGFSCNHRNQITKHFKFGNEYYKLTNQHYSETRQPPHRQRSYDNVSKAAVP